MLIVDSQVHTWAADTPERPWSGGGEPHRTVPFTNEDLLQEMDAAIMDGSSLRAGAVGYVMKGESMQRLLQAVRQEDDVAKGHALAIREPTRRPNRAAVQGRPGWP